MKKYAAKNTHTTFSRQKNKMCINI